MAIRRYSDWLGILKAAGNASVGGAGLVILIVAACSVLEPANSFNNEIASALSGPPGWLIVGAFLVISVAGIGYPCLSVMSVLPNVATFQSLKRWHRDLIRALSNSPSPQVLNPAGTSSFLSAYPSCRMAAPNAASLSGASPQLE